RRRLAFDDSPRAAACAPAHRRPFTLAAARARRGDQHAGVRARLRVRRREDAAPRGATRGHLVSALFDVRGKLALVTGASSGLGENFARRLAAEGAAVAVAARRTDRLERLVAEIASAGGKAQAFALDVAEPAS